MEVTEFERCPGCGAELAKIDGPVHRYIGASPACWAIYTSLVNGGEPPLTPAASNVLLTDAYAAQHPGVPSDQAIQSVAVHLLALYGVLKRGVAPENALWLRQRPLREKRSSKRGRFAWLAPPSFAGSLTVADIVREPMPAGRTEKARAYVEQVWSLWSEQHLQTIASWYDKFIVPDEL